MVRLTQQGPSEMIAAVALTNNSPRLGMIIFVSFEITVLVGVVFGECGFENELGENVKFKDLKYKFEILNTSENANDCDVLPSTPAPTPVAPQSIFTLVDSRIIFHQQIVSKCENDIVLCQGYEFDATFVLQVGISIGLIAPRFATLLSNSIVVSIIGYVTFGRAIAGADCDAGSRILRCMLCFIQYFVLFVHMVLFRFVNLDQENCHQHDHSLFLFAKFLTGRAVDVSLGAEETAKPIEPLLIILLHEYLFLVLLGFVLFRNSSFFGTLLLSTQNTISFTGIGIGFDCNVLSPPTPVPPCQTEIELNDINNALPENFSLEYILGVDTHKNDINNEMIYGM